MKGKKFVGFGEMLLRMSPEGYLRFAQANKFDLSYSGAEGNMAVALSYMGMESELVTRLPENDIGMCAKRVLDHYGVRTGHIAFGGERLGVYYLEKGASQRPSKVIYDRKHSAFSESRPGDYDWDEIFEDAGWFHFTGITAALSHTVREVCAEACAAAKRHGVTVSCDLNYRKTLWSEQEAQSVMRPLMESVDVLFANEEDIEKSLGLRAADSDVVSGKLSVAGYSALMGRLAGEFGFKAVAVSLRESLSASDNNWSALLYSGGEVYESKKYGIHIVDRVGGGDSFASGMIYAMLNDYAPQDAVEFAVAASCLKHSIEYDFNLSTPEEVLALARGDGSGRISR